MADGNIDFVNINSATLIEPGSNFTGGVKGNAESTLPTYEQATGIMESSRLPRYHGATRYHPYKRPLQLCDEDPDIQFFNTIYDEEGVILEVPDVDAGGRNDPAVAHVDRVAANQVEEYNRRVQNIAAIIMQEFVAGLMRARHPEE